MNRSCANPGGCAFNRSGADPLCVLHMLDRDAPGWRELEQPELGRVWREVMAGKRRPATTSPPDAFSTTG